MTLIIMANCLYRESTPLPHSGGAKIISKHRWHLNMNVMFSYSFTVTIPIMSHNFEMNEMASNVEERGFSSPVFHSDKVSSNKKDK